MKRHALALILLTTAAVAAESLIIPVKFDEAWRRANQALVVRGLQISRSDKDAGIVEASAESPPPVGTFTCPKSQGIYSAGHVSVSVLLNDAGEQRTGVRVTASATVTFYKNTALSLPAYRVYTTATCTSTGDLEREVLGLITGESTTEQ